MKRPNSYGSVINLGRSRRKPYAVRVTDLAASHIPDEDGNCRQKYKYLSYHSTKAEAYAALNKYNEDKVAINYIGITFGEIWHIWAERNLCKSTVSRVNAYKAAAQKCEPLFDKRIDTLRLHDLQEVVDQYAGASKSTLNNLKIVMGFVYDWAIKNDIVTKDYSKYVETDPREVENHAPFKHSEVDSLLNKENLDETEKIILMYIYTGVRPNELLELKKCNVHLPEQYFNIKKSKTKSGVRIVPIADKVLPIFEEFYNNSLTDNFINISYTVYKKNFYTYYPNHTPHDTRSTFISYMTEADVQQITIQKIVGHSSGNVTGDVYTKLTLKPLLEAVNKL